MNDEAMEHRLNVVETDVKELKVVVGGEQLTGKPGVLQHQMRMLTTLFDEKEGLVPRLTTMERRELERVSWVKGAKFVWVVFGAIAGFVLKLMVELLFKK